MSYLPSLVAVIAAYLVGSLSFAVIVSRLMGLADPRSYGSKNPGATNVLRSGNKKAAALTLLFDLLKGLIPVALLTLFGDRVGIDTNGVALVALAAFLGHLWPVFFRFQGGKGVATAAGVLLGLNGWFGLAVLGVWLLVAYTTRYSSLAALIAAASAPFIHALIWGISGATVLIGVMSLLLIWRHSSNINKLLAGTESRIGQKPSSQAAPADQTQTAAPSAHDAPKVGSHKRSHGPRRKHR